MRIVQQFDVRHEAEFMAQEQQFAQLERSRPDYPWGRRLQPISGGEPTNTLIWETEFPNLEATLSALDYIAGDANRERLLTQQMLFVPPYLRRSVVLTLGPTILSSWLLPRVLELTYTASDLQPFAHDCGYDGPPFRWDEERRFLLRCELDAAYFHLYGIERDDVEYILETFPIVKRKDVAQHGEFRTKRVILEIYDEMAEAMRTGVAYRTRLDPPPADARVAHAPKATPTPDE